MGVFTGLLRPPGSLASCMAGARSVSTPSPTLTCVKEDECSTGFSYIKIGIKFEYFLYGKIEKYMEYF